MDNLWLEVTLPVPAEELDRVSRVLGVSQVQVSRIERRAVAKLREELTE